MADETKKVLLDLQLDTSDIDKSVVSLKTLADANKKLREERKLVNIETEEGRKRIEQLNQMIDKNDKLIKQNSSSLEKQRLNVGNYTKSIQEAIPALDGMTGGAASAAQGIVGMTKSALAFIATPIGAVIAALGLALGALMTYFKGSDEAQDRLAEGTAVLGVAFDGLKLIVEKVGEVVFKVFDFINAQVKSFIDFIAPSIGKEIDKIVIQGKMIAKLQDDLENLENENLIKRAVIAQKVSKLREDSIKQEGEQRRKTIEEAIRLEQQLSDINVEESKKRLGAFLAEVASKGELTGEEKRKQAELTAAVINAETERTDATRKFQKELEGLREKEKKAQDEEYARNLALRQFNEENDNATLERLSLIQQAKRDAADENIKLNEQLNIDTSENLDEMSAKEEAELQKSIERGRARVQWAQRNETEKLRIASGGLQQAANLFQRDSAEYKALTTARAIVDTYASANLALKSFPPPIGGVFAALNIATGLANVAAINSVKFAQGGSVLSNGVRWGTVGGRTHSEGGTKYFGEDGNVVELEKNEGWFVAKVDAHRDFINSMSGLNQKHGGNSWLGRSPLRRFAEGGSVVFSGQSAYDNRQLADLINQVKVAVVIDDVEAKAIERNDRINRAQVL